MSIKEINYEIAAIEYQSFNTERSKKFIKRIKSGRIAVLPVEIIETPLNSSDLQYGE